MKRAVFALLTVIASSGCGGDENSINADTDEFDVDAADQKEIDDAAASGDGAGGTFDYDQSAGLLTISITSTSFDCGIETGEFVAAVTSLTATTMVWDFEGDGGVTWTRIDSGSTGVVGVWQTDDPNLFMILSSDGSAEIFGEAPCEDDDRERNGDGCYQMRLSGIDVQLDGNLSEWSGVHSDGTLDDPSGDYSGDDDGADLRSLKVEFSGDSLYVLSLLWNSPSENFQSGPPPNSGTYRLTVRGDGGLSFSERLYYQDGGPGWTTMGDAAEVSAAVGGDGIEWEVDVSNFNGEGFDAIDLIMIEPMDCGSGSCEALDYMDCGYVEIPMN